MVKNANISKIIQNTVEDNALPFPELIDQILNRAHGQDSEFHVNNESMVQNSATNLSKCNSCGISFSSSETLKKHVYLDHEQKSFPPAQYFEAHRNTVHDDFKKPFYTGRHYAQWAKSRKKDNLGN